MLNMRTVSFVEHLCLNVDGKVNPNCMVVEDIDNDKINELIVCKSDGGVVIFKGNSLKPWYTFQTNCDVSSILAGDIYNQGKNSLLIIGNDGNICIVEIEVINSVITHTSRCVKVMINISQVLLADINKDGRLVLLACHSDCHVSAYRWEEGKLNILQIWKLPNFAGNIAIHGGTNKQTSIMVSQPGCSYAVLRTTDWNNPQKLNCKAENGSINGCRICGPEYIEFTPLSSRTRLQNPDVNCQIIGDIRKGSHADSNDQKDYGYIALCTLDGTIKLMEECTILWSVQVDHQLFAVAKMDVLGDCREEVIVCAWDGQTYIVDHDKNVVRYHFHSKVQSFCAGRFSIDGKNNFPSLVYGDFNGNIWLYYDVRLPFLHASDLISEAEKDEDTLKMFEQFRLKNEKERKEFLRYCLYELPTINKIENMNEEET